MKPALLFLCAAVLLFGVMKPYQRNYLSAGWIIPGLLLLWAFYVLGTELGWY
ncbi:MAG: hypothetical protein JWR49_3833 [Tardiphaga sp.]|jgi:hypothetical protein|nr:hypothetical protein [Tardiphaga sp.]